MLVATYFVILSEAKDLVDRKDEILRSLRSLRMTCFLVPMLRVGTSKELKDADQEHVSMTRWRDVQPN